MAGRDTSAYLRVVSSVAWVALADSAGAPWLTYTLRSQRRNRNLVVATAVVLLIGAGFLTYLSLRGPRTAETPQRSVPSVPAGTSPL